MTYYNNSNSSRHFANLQRFIALNYSCRDHNEPYTLFHLKKKSLFCCFCIEEMQSYLNPVDLNDLFYFETKEKILSKFLHVFNFKYCDRHNKPYKMFCLFHIKYYCEDCSKYSNCKNDVIVILKQPDIKRYSTNNRDNNILHFHKNGKVFKAADKLNKTRGIQSYNLNNNPKFYNAEAESFEQEEEESEEGDNSYLLNKSRNVSAISANNSSYGIIKKLEDFETKTKENSYKLDEKSKNTFLYSGFDLFSGSNKNNLQSSDNPILINQINKNNKLQEFPLNKNLGTKSEIESKLIPVPNKPITLDTLSNNKNTAKLISNSTGKKIYYPFINGKNLIIFCIDDLLYTKYKISNISNLKNNFYIVKYLPSNNLIDKYSDFVFFIKENQLNIFSTKEKQIREVFKFNTHYPANNLLGISSDDKIFGLDQKSEFFYYDVKSNMCKKNEKAEENESKDNKDCDNLIEGFLLEEIHRRKINSYPSFLFTENNSSKDYNSVASDKIYLFIQIVAIKKQGITICVFNNNYSKFNSIYQNQKFTFHIFVEETGDYDSDDEECINPSLSKNILHKIKSCCKNSFFYYDVSTKKIFLVFMFEDEVCHFSIDMENKQFKLSKSFPIYGVDACLVKSQDSNGSIINQNQILSSLNLIVNSDLFYLNKEYVLIKYCIVSNKVEEYFEFI